MNAGQAASRVAFAAVLLAGGASRRMGRDKALLRLPEGRLLWQRQLAVLEALGPAELFISGPAKDGYPASVRRLDDAVSGLGPLSGIAAALRVAQVPLLVVLAIDLPVMTAGFLRRLLDGCGPELGRVPRHGESGLYEPLAAVYPRVCGQLAERRLHKADRSMQAFVQAAGSLLEPHEIAPEEEPLFANWNEPASYQGRPDDGSPEFGLRL
jgi:molybdopterin-guanine dinucleotide biosynthesis protein A